MDEQSFEWPNNWLGFLDGRPESVDNGGVNPDTVAVISTSQDYLMDETTCDVESFLHQDGEIALSASSASVSADDSSDSASQDPLDAVFELPVYETPKLSGLECDERSLPKRSRGRPRKEALPSVTLQTTERLKEMNHYRRALDTMNIVTTQELKRRKAKRRALPEITALLLFNKSFELPMSEVQIRKFNATNQEKKEKRKKVYKVSQEAIVLEDSSAQPPEKFTKLEPPFALNLSLASIYKK